MGTAKNLTVGPVHPFMGERGVTDVSPGTAVMGGTRAESRGLEATLGTTITATVAQRAETRIHGIQRTGNH